MARLFGTRGSTRRRVSLVVAVLSVSALLGTFAMPAQALLNRTVFELDKDAQNDISYSHLAELAANISATQSPFTVCQDASANQATPFTILVDAERMTVTAVGNASGGGCTGAFKRTYTVTRGAGGTTAASHSGGEDVSLMTFGSVAGNDWDQVYNAVQANPTATNPCAGLGATACSYVHDGVGVSTFTTGGSKDDLDIPNWRWIDGSVPDSDELLDGMAAKYLAGGHQNLYFAADREAVNGAKDMGFWFFHSPVSLNADGTFSGTHTVGDILALSTFTQGGATTSIRVFEWVGTGGNATANGTVQGPLGTFPDCAGGAAANGCATVNNTTIESPWAYLGKAESYSNEIPSGGFLEGGIDLTALGLEGCFSNFLAETRSSPSVDATLKDFILGRFEACGSTLTTSPADNTGTALSTDSDNDGLKELSIGTGSVQAKDLANLSVNGTSTWSGTLKFFICGPIASGTCSSGGPQIGSSIAVSQATTMPVASQAATLTSAGRYCWRGEFTSSTQGVPNASDSSTGECFEVLPVTPTLDTQAVASPVDFGNAVQDNATLSGTANQPGTNGPNSTYPSINATNGAAAGGKITFTLLGPNDCSTVTSNGTGTNPQDVNVSGNATYGPVSYTPGAPGTYHWKAQYTPAAGDPNNIGSTHNATCTDSDEDVVVRQIPSDVKTKQSWYPNDTATISTTVAGTNLAAGGTVDFTLYNDATCGGTGTAQYTERVTLNNTIASSKEVSTSNYPGSTGVKPDGTPVTPYRITTGYSDTAGSTAGPYSWKVVYAPPASDTAHTGSSSSCTANHTETFSITYTNDPGH